MAPRTTASPNTANAPPTDAASDAASDSQPAAAAPPSSPKPAADVKPVTPVDPVSEARKYLYGRGVQQNCDRGLRILKPAANQANAKAMVEMGALYSAGLCAPRDLPTAYRWFAMALRKEPDNQSVQADLQKLWGEMTQPERQLAIRLSQ
jgi:TPR repeat protein